MRPPWTILISQISGMSKAEGRVGKGRCIEQRAGNEHSWGNVKHCLVSVNHQTYKSFAKFVEHKIAPQPSGRRLLRCMQNISWNHMQMKNFPREFLWKLSKHFGKAQREDSTEGFTWTLGPEGCSVQQCPWVGLTECWPPNPKTPVRWAREVELAKLASFAHGLGQPAHPMCAG